VTSSNVRLAAGILAAGFAAACGPVAVGTGPGPAPAGPEYVPVSPALPAIPAADGPLDIRVVHPTPGTTRPQVDSTFIFGSVGSGRAALSINGVPVPVAPNGAFLAFLAVPQDGVWSLEASRGTQRVTAQRAYASPPAAAAAPATPAADVVPVGVFERPRAGTVTGGADTLATGSDAIPGRPTPSGSYDWFFPRGTRLSVVERRGQQYRVSLGGGTDAWVAMDAVTLGTAEPPAPATVAAPVFRAAAGGHTEMVVRGARGAPFRVEAADRALRLTVHGVQGGAAPRPRASRSCRASRLRRWRAASVTRWRSPARRGDTRRGTRPTATWCSACARRRASMPGSRSAASASSSTPATRPAVPRGPRG
jgi:hypothetical protein